MANERGWAGVGVRLIQAEKPPNALRQEVVKNGIRHWHYVFASGVLNI